MKNKNEKPVSTFDKFMQDPKQKEKFDKNIASLLLKNSY